MQLARRGDKIERFSYLVLDEGQDLPAGFYSILPLIAENITIFADENQRITDQNTTIEEIKNALGINKVSYLTRNYRNTRAIAEFAAQFYSGLPSGIPALPDRQGPKPRLMLGRNYREQIDIIARYARNNPRFNIGVFLPTQRKQYGFFAELKKSLNIYR